MNETGFTVEAALPFSWGAGRAGASTHRSNMLLLRVANLLDTHESEQEEAGKRMEAKLDLMLHWLGQQLFGDVSTLPVVTLKLGGDSAEWEDNQESHAEGDGLLSLVIHPNLPSPLVLQGALRREAGRCRVELTFPDEETEEAWNRWLFRLHRRAIQEARQKGDLP